MRNSVLLAVFSVVLTSGGSALADDQLVQLPIQGYLYDDVGFELSDSVSVYFALYESETVGTEFWGVTRVVTPENGFFTVRLGEDTDLPAELLASRSNYWLGVTVEDDTEMDRVVISAPAYAQTAGDAETVGGQTVDDLTDWGNIANLPDGADVRTQSEIEGFARGVAFDTGAEVAAALVDVDGDGSGIDADTLDGHHASDFSDAVTLAGETPGYYLDWNNMTNRPSTGTAYTRSEIEGFATGVCLDSGTEALAVLLDVDGTGSGLDAETLAGSDQGFYRNATNLNAGELSTDRFSAIGDLSAEGLLDATDGTDLLTRDQSDARYMSSSTTVYSTSAAVLAAIKSVDTNSSGLNADTLDGEQGSYYRAWANITGLPTLYHTPAAILAAIKSVDTNSSGLNADTLDGEQGSFYRNASNINGGTLSTARYDAYADLASRLDNNNDADLLTRNQADARFVNETALKSTVDGFNDNWIDSSDIGADAIGASELDEDVITSDHVNTSSFCPSGTSRIGMWCIDDSIRSSDSWGGAVEECHDDGAALCPLAAMVTCDQGSVGAGTGTSRCKWATDNSIPIWVLEPDSSALNTDVFGHVRAYEGGGSGNNLLRQYPHTQPLGYYCCSMAVGR